MRRSLGVAFGLFTLSAATLVGAWILGDRTNVRHELEERTDALSKMMSAHGDAAIAEADKIALMLETRVAEWDLDDPITGQRLFAELQKLVKASAYISSAWVTDAAGLSRLDSWTYPPEPIVAKREYFQRHAAGEDFLVLGDERPGGISGKQRFTVSRAVRNSDGSLHAVIAVGVYTDAFQTLYGEVARWPDARAGLYRVNAMPLARTTAIKPATSRFLQELDQHVGKEPAGHTVLEDHGVARLVSWQRSRTYPEIYASTSQSLTLAMEQWRERSLILVAVTAHMLAAIGLLVWVSLQAAEARQQARVNELAVREVHHRVKNALQLIVSMIGLRASKLPDDNMRGEIEEIASRVRAIGEVQDLLQRSASLEAVDAVELIRNLCQSYQKSYSGEIRCYANGSLMLDSAKATTMAVIANELLTNALKHGDGIVSVDCATNHTHFTVSVSDNGPGLPDGFDLAGNNRFGLRVARMMAEGIGATLNAAQPGTGGAVFSLVIPHLPASA